MVERRSGLLFGLTLELSGGAAVRLERIIRFQNLKHPLLSLLTAATEHSTRH